MAFPVGWNRKCKITIDNTKVAATESNFTVPFLLANMPSEMFDADGSYPANADGGDIRFSSDAAGSSQLARDLVEFTRDNNPANGSIEVHVNIASLASATDTDIYVWYNNSGASEPAEDATYGREAAWPATHKGVWHLEESGNGTANEFLDSTSSDNDGRGGDGTGSKTPTQAAGTLGNGNDFDGTDDFIACGTGLDITSEDFTIQFIATPDNLNGAGSTDGRSVFIYKGGFRVGGYYVQRIDTDELKLVTNQSGADQETVTNTGVFTAGVTTLCHITKVSGAGGCSIYKDGVEAGYSAQPAHTDPATSSETFNIGRYATYAPEFHTNGVVDEVRVIVGTALDQDWITTENNCLMDSANFSSAGTPEDGVPSINGYNAIHFGTNF